MNIKIDILNVPKHCNKHDLIHFVTDNRSPNKYNYRKQCKQAVDIPCVNSRMEFKNFA